MQSRIEVAVHSDRQRSPLAMFLRYGSDPISDFCRLLQQIATRGGRRGLLVVKFPRRGLQRVNQCAARVLRHLEQFLPHEWTANSKLIEPLEERKARAADREERRRERERDTDVYLSFQLPINIDGNHSRAELQQGSNRSHGRRGPEQADVVPR